MPVTTSIPYYLSSPVTRGVQRDAAGQNANANLQTHCHDNIDAHRNDDSHGTHTAGTICGRNFRGVNIGVAPKAKLASALVLPGGEGTFAQIIAGMQWTVTQGVQAINLSLGGIGYTTLWNLPVLNATLSGALVVASIGNSGHGTSGGPGNDSKYLPGNDRRLWRSW